MLAGCSTHQGQIQPVRLGGVLSVMFVSQVPLSVHYRK